MRRLAIILVLALGLVLVGAQASLAASPHFKHRDLANPVGHKGRRP
jgi:hypothetical protein